MNELHCKHCKKYLGTAHGTAIVELLCPNSSCKAENQFKIISADSSKDLSFKFTKEPRPPKQKEPVIS